MGKRQWGVHMEFFVMPYRILFHDTMAYGSHHFMTNFKFQCLVREHLLFDHTVDVTAPVGKTTFDKFILLTQQGYCRNMAPVRVGEKVAILMSAEEQTMSTIRFCFRVIRYDGVPVTCGFQTIVCILSDTGAVVPAPPFVLQYGKRLKERLESPSFADRVLSGRTKEVFDDATIALGISVANSEPAQSYPRFVTAEVAAGSGSAASPEVNLRNGIIFTFPGQGSYAPWALRDFYHNDKESALILQRASEITERLIGEPFLPLITAASDASHDTIMARYPDLAQVGIYLGSVITAHYLIRNGLTPAGVIGHSAGELAALAISGVYSIETGVEVVCYRIRALQSLNLDPAGMLAVLCAENRVRSAISDLGPCSLQISVVNHDEQTVVSGTWADLQRLEQWMAQLGIQFIRLKSRYPFHSALLRPAVDQFEVSLRTLKFCPPSIPVYSPIEKGFYSAKSDIAGLLASHFVRPFTFPEALRRLSNMRGRVFIECGGGDVLSNLVRRTLADQEGLKVHSPLATGRGAEDGLRKIIVEYTTEVPLSQPAEAKSSGIASSETDGAGKATDVPVAIISMGCVLPGANGPGEFWRNILEGRSGIFNASELRPDMALDFLSKGEVVPDKTYTLLGGFISNINPHMSKLPYSDREFARLSSAQRFLAVAMSQCLSGLNSERPRSDGIYVILGSSGDGIIEYDESLLLAGLHHEVDQLSETRERLDSFHKLLDTAVGRTMHDLREFAPYTSYLAVVEKFIGTGVKVMGVDAACSSSLYAIDLGISALRRGECNVALCGGVFAPGPANSCFFSQFQGLSATGSRPLDASADGVVFGEGSALVVLKRLPDALADGDHIHAIIRGSGLSNDGKSPSVAEPRKRGQVLALHRAYHDTGIALQTVQYIEAHATGTPRGDVVEFEALNEVFKDRDGHLPPIELGSVKALIGHTGWLAGAASVIKTAEALKAKLVPPQHNFSKPNPKFDISRSPFSISTAPKPWPENAGGEPRRVGINGFGFGGSNAHMIMEEYVPQYHRSRWANTPKPVKSPMRVMGVVGIGVLFPFSDNPQQSKTDGDNAPALRFNKSTIKLPKGLLVMPDVADHMSKDQFLACMATFDALKTIGEAWKMWKSEIGVILGVGGKTGRGISANKRIYLDFLERRLNEISESSNLPQSEFTHVKNELFTSIRSIIPSGPYTLPGLMPNVTAGRVANLFDLNGPNFIIDSGDYSLYESLCSADAMLSTGKARMILAGGINGFAGPEAQYAENSPQTLGSRPIAEAAMVLALVSPDTARTYNLPVLAEIEIFSDRPDAVPVDGIRVGEKGCPYYLKGAEGAFDLAEAIKAIEQKQKPADLIWPAHHGENDRIIRVAAPGTYELSKKDRTYGKQRSAVEVIDPAHPIFYCTPRLTAVDAKPVTMSYAIQKGRILILTDQTAWQDSAEARKILDEMEPTTLCPAAHCVPGAMPVDLSSDAAISESLRSVDFNRYTAIIAIKDLAGGDSALETVVADAGSGGGLLDLMFAVVRQAYDRLKEGNTVLGSLCLNAVKGELVHPFSGLLAGFVKAIARELPQAVCKALATDTDNLRHALQQMETERGQGPLPAAAEVVYINSLRHEYRLDRLPTLSSGEVPLIGADSVVIATGGGRGVTAVLVEELLRIHGCSVILLGRTDLSTFPAHFLSMDKDEFDRYETEFYRAEIARTPGTRIGDLKRRYEHIRNAREVRDTVSTLSRLPGKVEYIPIDITDGQAVDGVIRKVAEKFGRVDLVIHGAGLQVSKNTSRKTIEEFRRVVATKIGGLGNLYRSYRKHLPAGKTHFHMITSVFSYFGNDGQPDYGAANEAMNSIANYMGNSTGSEWTTLSWLGWAGIGMTRGSEYEVLARLRGLRPITMKEGQAIFSELLRGKPHARANLLISEGEIAFYGVRMAESHSPAPTAAVHELMAPGILKHKDSGEVAWNLSEQSHPYILDHMVDGRPTYPGSFEGELAAQTAHSLRPDFHVVALENTNLARFIKLPPHSGDLTLRGRAQVVGESGGDTLVKVQLLSDFIHSSGKVLQKDIVHFETVVHLVQTPRVLAARDIGSGAFSGMCVFDPYLSPESFVRLKGFFECLSDIEIGWNERRGRFRIRNTDKLHLLSNFLTPSIMMDAVLRFSMINVTAEGVMPLYVPIRCQEIHLMAGINDAKLAAQGEEITLAGTNPIIEGKTIYNHRVQASDKKGRVLLVARELTALWVGEVSAKEIKRVET